MTQEEYVKECPWAATVAGWQKGATETEGSGRDESDAAERATVAQLNRDALSKVQEETGQVLPAGTYSLWRATQRKRGCIDGIGEGVIVATDGVLGIFVDCPVKVGHVHRFRWTTESIFGEVTEHVGAPPALFGVSGKSNSAARQNGAKVKVKSAKARFMEELLA